MKTILSLLLLMFAVTLPAQQYYENRGFKALMNGKIPVEVMFQTYHNQYEDKWMTAGYLYYPKAKTPAPILIVEGWYPEKPIVSKDEDETVSRFVEYQPDGEVTGTLYVTYVEVEGDFQMRRASWKNPTTGKVLLLSHFEEMRDLPSWYPGPPAVLHGPTRLDWKFNTRLYNEEEPDSEWLSVIEVDFLAKGKKQFTVKEDLMGAHNREMEKKWEWVTHEDINFDGQPDVMIYLGCTHNGNSLYKAFVWNAFTRQFYPVPEFDEIQEPEFDKEDKTITSRARDGQNMYIDTWKWKNGKLKKISNQIKPLR
jgi:hypothetical protein